METAGEGGAWGIALLADYMIKKEDGEALDMYPAISINCCFAAELWENNIRPNHDMPSVTMQ